MRLKTGAELLLVLTFLLGGVTGGIGYYLYENHVASAATKTDQSSPRRLADQLAEGLSLYAAQKEKISVIINKGREKYHGLSEQFRPQYDAIRNETRAEIREILREDQRAQFEQILKERESHRKQRFPR